jgi:hypothetical protein
VPAAIADAYVSAVLRLMIVDIYKSKYKKVDTKSIFLNNLITADIIIPNLILAVSASRKAL